MTAFFDYPKAAAFGRKVPKRKIYQHTHAKSALKALFVNQVDQITWAFKLAPETINLAATKSVPEIQVFHITLKAAELDFAVLRAIDKAIPFPLIFELSYKDKCKIVAAYKRPNEADGGKWVISEYLATQWEPENTIRAPLPVALNLAGLYEELLSPLLPISTGQLAAGGKNIKERVANMEHIAAKQREVTKIEGHLAKEKQFNRRVAINAELRGAKQELEALAGASAPQSTPVE